MARERVNKFSAESFTNSIGQTLQPGDKVVAVTTGYGHSVSVFEGVFEGVYRGPSYYGSDKQQISGTRISQIPVTYNEQEFVEDGVEEEKVYKGYNRDTRQYEYEKTGRRYNWVKKVKYRKSSLQRNRVFKVDTELTKVTI
jgi:cystathionine beta-lyase/cystathionine gamma-synthase